VGTSVSQELPMPDLQARSRAVKTSAGFDMPARAVQPRSGSPRTRLPLLGGVPEIKLLPRAELARAYRRVLLSAAGHNLLDYGSPQSDERLREAVAQLLKQSRGIAVAPESLNMVRGTQQALHLAARALLEPGDRVAIEAYSHPALRGTLLIQLDGGLEGGEPVAANADVVAN
jgi:GntR family transcriptional regulator / MocR family aminotransferase